MGREKGKEGKERAQREGKEGGKGRGSGGRALVKLKIGPGDIVWPDL